MNSYKITIVLIECLKGGLNTVIERRPSLACFDTIGTALRERQAIPIQIVQNAHGKANRLLVSIIAVSELAA